MRTGTDDAHRSQVADVEDGGRLPTGHMLGDRPRAELEWHLPTAERDQPCPVVPVPPVERAVAETGRSVSEQPGPAPCGRWANQLTRCWAEPARAHPLGARPGEPPGAR